MCYTILIYYVLSLHICMNIWVWININATIIYIHYIQIRAWSLPPDNTPSVIGQCICVYTLTLYINAHHKAYTHNALLYMHFTYVYVITSPFFCCQRPSLLLTMWHALNWLPMNACGLTCFELAVYECMWFVWPLLKSPKLDLFISKF